MISCPKSLVPQASARRIVFCKLLLGVIALAVASTTAWARVSHPLDPLSSQEILQTVDILRSAGKTTTESRYSLIKLQEPPKNELLQYHPGDALDRQSFAVIYERASNKTFEAVVDLTKGTLISWKNIPGVQPSFLEEDAAILQRAVRADPRFPEIMKRRGITDLSRVGIGDWPGGYFGDPAEKDVRFRRADFAYRDPKTSAERKIENLTADVDLNTEKVFRWIDGDVVPIPNEAAGLSGVPPTPTRRGPRPLIASEPQGTTFEVQGHEVTWQNWHFRFGFNSREGLILYTVGYEDNGRLRSILYRGTCSEMVVPYGDPGINWYYKNAFDSGEDSFGRYASPLEAGTDVPDYAKTFNVVLPSEEGDWFQIPRAVALYERDGGLLWKHYDKDHDRNESRRSRELVLAWIATVGNYDYGFDWVFHENGTLEMQVLLTGFMETKASTITSVSSDNHHEGDLSAKGTDACRHAKEELPCPSGGTPQTVPVLREFPEKYGHLVAPNLVAVHHQHFFNFRLDMDVDGTDNSVVENNTRSLPEGPDNRYQNAFTMTETLFHNEEEAERQMSLGASRRWTIINPSVKNALGSPVGYTLLPEGNALPYSGADSWIRKRSGFTNAPFWVTPYDPGQMHAAGFYVNQSKGTDGLDHWVKAKRSIENKDLVVWYTLGVTHIPRPEEYPVMDVQKAGFMLVPSSFFSANPSIGLPSGSASP